MKRYVIVLSILVMPNLYPTVGAQRAEPETTALVGGRLIDGTGRPAVENAAVVIRGDRIIAAGPRASVTIPAGAMVIPVEGKTVMPGLIESNGHIVFNGQANHTLYWARRWEQYYEIGARNLYTNLMQGVTTVRDTMDPLDTMVQLRNDVASGRIAGSRVFTCGSILNYPGFYSTYGSALKTYSPDAQSLLPEQIEKAREAMELTVRDAAHGREIVRDYARRGVDFIKVSADSGPKNLPPALSTEALREIVDEAHRHNLPVTTHTSTLKGLRAVLDAGVDAMEHPTLFTDGDFPEGGIPADVVQRIVRQKVFSVSLLVTLDVYVWYLEHPSRLDDPYYIRNAPADLVQEAREWIAFEREAGPRPVGTTDWWKVVQFAKQNLKKFIDAGALIAMGTDKGTRFNWHESMNHVREMEMFIELGMSPMDVIVAATRRGAELLRKQDEFGTVEAGKLADVIVVDGNPLERMSTLRSVKMVFKGGVRYK